MRFDTRSVFSFVCCSLILFTVSAASFAGFYEKWHFREAFPERGIPTTGLSLDVILDGTASRPFVYRQLLPAIANGIDSITPATFKDRLYTFRTSHGKLLRERFFLSPMARSQQYFFRYAVIYALTFVFALIATVAMFALVRDQGFDSLTAGAAASILILLVPVFMSIGGFYYDYVELAFLVLAVLIALRSHWALIIPLALLATWNKESFLFFVPCLYPLFRGRLSRGLSLVATVAGGLASCIIVFALHSHFAPNPGGPIEFHLGDQISFLLHPMGMFVPRDETYGFVGLPSLNPITLAIVIFLIYEGWRGLSRVIRRFTLCAAIINLPLYFLFCEPGELRDLSFLYASLLLLIAVQLRNAEVGQNLRLPLEGNSMRQSAISHVGTSS
jgi:hypothetical protein